MYYKKFETNYFRKRCSVSFTATLWMVPQTIFPQPAVYLHRILPQLQLTLEFVVMVTMFHNMNLWNTLVWIHVNVVITVLFLFWCYWRWFKMSEISPRSENVKVVVRVRPISESEKKAGHTIIVEVDGVNNGITICNKSMSTSVNELEKTFAFDEVFNQESSQVIKISLKIKVGWLIKLLVNLDGSLQSSS